MGFDKTHGWVFERPRVGFENPWVGFDFLTKMLKKISTKKLANKFYILDNPWVVFKNHGWVFKTQAWVLKSHGCFFQNPGVGFEKARVGFSENPCVGFEWETHPWVLKLTHGFSKPTPGF